MIELKRFSDDPYQDIYDEVEADIDTIDKDKLFSYCLYICEKIFAVAEVDYGKKPRNLPEDLIEDIGRGLLELRRIKIVSPGDLLKRTRRSFRSCACDKYGEDKKYSIKQRCISLSNLKQLLQDVLPLENDLPEIERKIRHIRQIYLPAFFGLKYSKDDSPEVRFEKLRLILILYSFKENMKSDLGYFLKKSSLRSVGLSENYKVGVNYVKEMVANRLSYGDVMQLERWTRSEYNCIRLLDSEIIKSTLQKMKCVNCNVSRMIMEKMYLLFCERLTSFDCHTKAVTVKVPVEVDAYVYFSQQVLLGGFVASDVKQAKWMNIQPETYDRVSSMQADNKEDVILLNANSVKEFIRKNRHEIAQLVTNNKAEHKDRVRILDKNSIRDYLLIVRICQLGFHVKKESRRTVSADTLLWLIFLYEGCKCNKVDFSRIDKGDNKNRRKMINSVFASIINYESDEDFLSENWKHVGTIDWLTHKIFMLKTYRTPYIVALQRRVQKKVQRFWKNNIPILGEAGVDCPFRCIDDIGKALINEEDIRKILSEISDGNK